MAKDVDILPFHPDRASQREWSRFHRYRRLRHEEVNPGDPILGDAVVQGLMERPFPDDEVLRFAIVLASDPDTQIGHLELWVTREDSPEYASNKHLASADFAVLAPYRRQGNGRRLLARVLTLVREMDKSTLRFQTVEEDGRAFLKAIGASVALRGQENRLYLREVNWDLVQQWAEAGPRRSPQTKMRRFTDHVDDEVLEAFCVTLTETLNQQPFDELERGEIIVTPETARVWEDRMTAVGGTSFLHATQEPDGEISGLTATYYNPDRRTFIQQGMTGVREVHRNRGLGKWLKADMLLRLREELPQVEVVVTGNATSNAAMLSINRRLGFRLHRESVTAQMSRERLEAYLQSRGFGSA